MSATSPGTSALLKGPCRWWSTARTEACPPVERAVGRLQAHHTETLGVRRLVSDVGRLLEDLAESGELPRPQAGMAEAGPHYVSDTPYPPDLWQDADDEGLDGRCR